MDAIDDWGVARGWHATDGTWRDAGDDAVAAVRTALGAAAHPDGPPDTTVHFVRPGEPAELPAGVLRLEDGTELALDGAPPPDLPLGAHELTPRDGDRARAVFVVPAAVEAPRRSWGWAVQLYGARSSGSWGHGDLADLAALARWADAAGASWLAHEPLGAFRPPAPGTGIGPSPYSASSRRFPSALYLRVEDVPGAELAADAVAAGAAAGRVLLDDRRIDRDAVWRVKGAALEAVWTEVRATVLAEEQRLGVDHDLDVHARFCALAEVHPGSWRDWPAGLRRPDSADVDRFAEEHTDRVAFWRWVTRSTSAQLAAAAAAGARLVGDLAVGFDPGGADAWVDQDLLAEGCRIGAPPDDFAPQGQDWGLTPYAPWRLRADGYRAWLATLRAGLRHAGALRIDHVMGLFRLYWVPPGATATGGTYVSQFGTELLDLAVMEAVRAGAALVGEDLGTVEPHVRDELGRRNVLGYRIGWFEDAPPSEWPPLSLAATTTHDLPTVAGLWTGADTARRAAAGLPSDPDGDALLRDRLRRLTGRPDDTDPAEMVRAAETAVASSGSLVAIATLEDALVLEDRPNQPGTVDEVPNWRTALPVLVDDLDQSEAPAIADAMNAAGRRRS